MPIRVDPAAFTLEPARLAAGSGVEYDGPGAEGLELEPFFEDDARQLLVTGESVVGHGYSGNFFVQFSEADDPSQYEYFVPEEGGTRWVDNMAVVADAPHPCTAHTFINFILDAKVGAQLSNFNQYATPNKAAKAFITPEDLANGAIYPSAEMMDKLEFINDLGDANKLYDEAWTQVKSK